MAGPASRSSGGGGGGGFVLDAQGQTDLLKEALRSSRDHAFRMKRAMDAGELGAVLKHAADVLRELRTSLLSPKNYYELYMQVLDELRQLESFLDELRASGTSMRVLYERVQSSGNVLPRLYLLVTVGAVSIKAGELPAREVLTDLVEMTKGVQHPLRGLFLRHYLTLAVKDNLPDAEPHTDGSKSRTNNTTPSRPSPAKQQHSSSQPDSVEDAIAFLLQNLSETTRLWIRMQHQTLPRSASASSTASTSSTNKWGDSKEAARASREKERQELKLLVGASLVRLSQLEAVSVRMYAHTVLPELLALLTDNPDRLAQSYLLDCVIQVFPDEFHLATLAALLHVLPQLHANVDRAALLVALLERLLQFHARGGCAGGVDRQNSVEGESPNGGDVDRGGAGAGDSDDLGDDPIDAAPAPLSQDAVFALVMTATDAMKSHTASVGSMAKLLATVTSFTLTCQSHKLDRVERVASTTLSFLEASSSTEDMVSRDELHVDRMVVAMLTHLSLAELRAVPTVGILLERLPWHTTHKRVALQWIDSLLLRQQQYQQQNPMRAAPVAECAADAELLLHLLAPLVRDPPNDTSMTVVSVENEAALEREQVALSKIVHILRLDHDLDATFAMFAVARRAFGQGGAFRIRHTLVPLVYSSLRLARDLALGQQRPSGRQDDRRRGQDQDSDDGGHKTVSVEVEVEVAPTTAPRDVLQFVHEMVTALASKVEQMSVTCVTLFLQCALVADACAFEAVAYEFITQAFIVYEDQITLARAQWQALERMVASLRATTQLSHDNYEVLATKTTQYAARLLKKGDQAAMVLHCAHLFWHPSYRDGKRVRECLQRSLKIADRAASDGGALTQVPLFLEILESYLYFYEAATPEITAQYLSGLLALVSEHLENMEHGTTRSDSEVRYRAIRRYMDGKAITLAL